MGTAVVSTPYKPIESSSNSYKQPLSQGVFEKATSMGIQSEQSVYDRLICSSVASIASTAFLKFSRILTFCYGLEAGKLSDS